MPDRSPGASIISARRASLPCTPGVLRPPRAFALGTAGGTRLENAVEDRLGRTERQVRRAAHRLLRLRREARLLRGPLEHLRSLLLHLADRRSDGAFLRRARARTRRHLPRR